MINYDYPTLFITEGTQKDFLLTDGEVTVSGTTYTVSDETIKFVNDDLEMEAFELNQSLNSSDQITFGSCEAAQIRFTARKAYGNSISDNSIVGTVLKLYLIPNHDASKMLQFGIYKVDEDKTTQDKNRHIITAYDAMYDILNKDVTDWYDDILQDEEATCTIEDFRDSFLNQFDLDVESTTLVNDNITIRRTIEKDRISGAEIIKAICEINGVFGTITNEGKFRFVALPNQIWGNDPLPEIPVSMYSEESHRDRVLSIQKLIIRCNDTISMTVGTPRIAEYNTYVISYNPLISDFTMAELRPVAFGLYQIVKGHAYAACSISALGNPLFEVGDAVKILTKSGSNYRTFIFERRLRGIQALRDAYSANGERYLSENLNSSYTQTKTMESQISQISQGGGSVAVSHDFPEIIRNIGFRLLDEPSGVTAEYDEINNEVSLKWTDPSDIATNEPCTATWAGTVVVRKENSAPLHRWDGTLIVDSTTRDEYSVNALVDNTVQDKKRYYYGIFPYDTKGDYRFTKVTKIDTKSITVDTVSLKSLLVTTDFNHIKDYRETSGDGETDITNVPSSLYGSDWLFLVGQKNAAQSDWDNTIEELFGYSPSINAYVGGATYIPITHSIIRNISFDYQATLNWDINIGLGWINDDSIDSITVGTIQGSGYVDQDVTRSGSISWNVNDVEADYLIIYKGYSFTNGVQFTFSNITVTTVS